MFGQLRGILLFILLIKNSTLAARILAIFPYPSYSHQVMQQSLTQSLAERGHELIVFTTDPINNNLTNYREISMNFLYDEFSKQFNYFDKNRSGYWSFVGELYKFGGTACDAIFSHPEMQRFLLSKKLSDKIDLILMSTVFYDSLYYLSDKFNVPIIGMSSFVNLPVIGYVMGNPVSTSFVPHLAIHYGDDMNFYQRLKNFYYNTRQILDYYYTNLPIQERVLKKHFGNNVPPIEELSKRIHLLFINSHPYFSYSRPILPNIIEVGGLRSQKMNKTLPTDLKRILDNATRGFIYFSLGSNIKSSELNNITLDKFIQAFSELPYQVIWKFESDHLRRIPDNISMRKWIPQQGVLAHPNIKLFIYQGGLQSTEEAIVNGIPMLGFPMFSDQWFNLNILIKRGVAKALDINAIDKYQIKNNIEDMIRNISYRNNTIKLRDILEDTPQHPMKLAIWWVEHVLRHKGADHLRTRAQELPWYIVELVDVFGFFVLLLVLLFLLGWTLWRLAIAMIKVSRRSCFDKINGPSTMKKKSKSS